MPRLPHPACVWTPNLLVPGAGEVLLGRIIVGTVRALVWACFASAAVYLVIFEPASDSRTVALCLACLAGGVYVSSQASLALGYRKRRQWLQNRDRDEVYKAATAAYLQGRFDEAETLLARLLKADPDDVEATLQQAAIARRRGNDEAARSRLCRARYLDDAGRWDFEIGRELAALEPQTEPQQK
ncbi:MAG: tetratricopeptide repeat protein [Planctomycetota bacterium]|nr:tetratricopeptide repeat protein [Planctomycetota bacterium]